MRAFINPSVRRDDAFRGLFSDEDYAEVSAFFDSQPDLVPTPVCRLPALAEAARIGHVEAKDETQRFRLNAFKIVGVSFAAHKLGGEAEKGLVCATAGNHGRAVAHIARRLGVRATIFVPAAGPALSPLEARTRESRIAAMRADGAEVCEVDGTYEDAVARAAGHGKANGATVLSDTSWAGYDQIPRWIMAGYTRIFEEASAQWAAPPDLVIVQGGVGGLVCAAASWFAHKYGPRRPYLIACEPEGAACLLESARAGRRVRIEGALDTMMAGLRCAEPSPLAWPTIVEGTDAFITIGDEQALEVQRLLDGPRSGPSGLCGAAALVGLGTAPEFVHVRHAAGLDRSSRALIVITEGA
jgi:diaminopropionate ammonia-lyase